MADDIIIYNCKKCNGESQIKPGQTKRCKPCASRRAIEWQKNNVEKRRATDRRTKKRMYANPEKYQEFLARQAVYLAKLPKKPCEVCGQIKAQAHHDDYNKPLDVRWLCHQHHVEWHGKNEPIRLITREDDYGNKK